VHALARGIELGARRQAHVGCTNALRATRDA